ncbi:MAG TPA: gamma-glutamyltransferase, partial [Thermoanaerobaculaceae bacterium]|nr:gamma-glutamyltransferase [Thermoanaerobaculaceae bacterium]
GAPEAARAGAAILAAGGNAVDAAVATAFALGSAEPVTSGIGGQAFLLIYLKDGRSVAIDGSCVVPALANPAELQAIRNVGDVRGYKSIAVPGTLAALAYALERYGTKSLAEVLAPAIDIAEFGFHMNTTELANVETYANKIQRGGYLADTFLKGFTGLWPPEHVFCSGDLAATLRRIARLGPDEFYHGRIADEIETDMVRNGGYVRKADLVQVRAIERPPLRGSYRGLDIITFPYPGGGGSLLEMLNILESFPPELLRGESLDRLHLLLEAGRITLHDLIAPTVPLPLLDRELAEKSHGAERARLIRFDRALRDREISDTDAAPYLVIGTTQVSVADRDGNVVALTQTIGASLGSGVATPGLGFAYNSNLDAFNYTNPLSPFFLAPGKVPATTLAPTIVLKDGKPFLAFGSAGSERIVPSMAVVLSAIADRGDDLRQAVATPRAVWGFDDQGQKGYLELAGEITPERAAALEKQGFRRSYEQGFPARWIDLMVFGGTNALLIDPDGHTFTGVGDPRRQGVAVAPGPPE